MFLRGPVRPQYFRCSSGALSDPTTLDVPLRSIYSGVYKLDMSDDNGSRIKRIYPSNTAPKPAPTALCNFVDLFDSSNSSGKPDYNW